MAKGSVDIRFSQSRGTSRFRFYDIHEDQQDVILEALKHARQILDTQSDTYALEMVCLQYLSTQAEDPCTPAPGTEAQGE